MKIGRVIGMVWATKKVSELHGCRLYVVQPVLSDGREVGSPLVVADPKNIAAPGDHIVFVTNTDASQAFDTGFAPVNASVVELVDDIA
ncbi:ethanolamine utilization protein EutN [candidate division KSB1 bacterium]|jgi:ethanolamine utilization protein EutN|nr:MAG: ethanolamine utilization protein EutN [candidate division KSB1 bacterium]